MKYEFVRHVYTGIGILTALAAIAFVAPVAAADATAAGKQPSPAVCTPLTNPLAIRLMNYGKYEDAAWTHLQSLGMHHVFMPVPAPDKRTALEKKMAENHLRPLVLRGDTDIGRESCVEELAGQLAVCEKMGVKFMFVTPGKHIGVSKEVAYERLRKAGDVARQHGVTIVLETHPDLGTNADVHRETMQQVNHPNVRVNFDTGNITF